MKDIRNYFSIKELVCKHVYDKHHDNAWNFLDPRLIRTLTFIRECLGKPIVVNNWANSGQYSQRGLRCNLCDLVASKTKNNQLYVSAHMQGEAVDFNVQGMTADQVRQWLENNKSLLPYHIRIEKDVNWVHLDVRAGEGDKDITYFKG